MVRQAPSRSRFPTKSPQAARGGKRPAGYAKPGGIAALTVGQVNVAARVISVDRKVVEVGGHLYVEPLGLVFPSPTGRHWRSSNHNRKVMQPAYRAAGWRDADRNGKWTWHSLRHVFCATALFTWKVEATDVSRMAGRSNYRITLDMYVGTTAGVLDRARLATQ